MLYSRAEVEGACYPRAPLETDAHNPEVAATATDLWRVFREILDRAKSVAEIEIARDEMTMSQKLDQIRALLAEAPSSSTCARCSPSPAPGAS